MRDFSILFFCGTICSVLIERTRALNARFSCSHLESNKIVKENQDRGWFRDGPRCPKKVSVKSCLLLPLTKFSKVCVFQRLSTSRLFDTYFVVKSFLQNLLTVPKLLLNLKSVRPERRYWQQVFSGTRYKETQFF